MNTKTILLAVAATAKANELKIEVNVDDYYTLYADGEQIGAADSLFFNQTWDAPDSAAVFALYAVDRWGGYRASMAINGVGTKRDDWLCASTSRNSQEEQLAGYPTGVNDAWANPDFDDSDRTVWKVPGVSYKDSPSLNNGEAFWAGGEHGQMWCRYHYPTEQPTDGSGSTATHEMVAALREELQSIRSENSEISSANDALSSQISAAMQELMAEQLLLQNQNGELNGKVGALHTSIAGMQEKFDAMPDMHDQELTILVNEMEAKTAKIVEEANVEIQNQKNLLDEIAQDAAAIEHACSEHHHDSSTMICTELHTEYHE